MINILHTADWHMNSDFDKGMESTEYIKNYIKENT